MSRVALACLLVCLALAGCGSSGTTTHGGSSGSSAATTSTTPATSSTPDASTTGATPPPGPWTGATAANQFVHTVTPFLDAKNQVTADTNVFGGKHLPTRKEFPAVWTPVIAHCAAASAAAGTAVATLTDARQKHYWPASALPAIGKAIGEIRWYDTLMKQCPQMHSTADVVRWFLTTDLKRENTVTATMQQAVDALKVT